MLKTLTIKDANIIGFTVHSMVGRASWISAIAWLAGLVWQGRVGFRLRYD